MGIRKDSLKLICDRISHLEGEDITLTLEIVVELENLHQLRQGIRKYLSTISGWGPSGAAVFPEHEDDESPLLKRLEKP